MSNTNRRQKPNCNKTIKICLIIITAVLLAIVSKFSSHMHHTGQAVFAIIFTTGLLTIGSYGSAFSISLLAGSIYSLTSVLGFFILISWFMRGITTDLLLRAMNVFNSSDPSPYKVTVAMTTGSLVTGLAHYFVLVKVLHLIPNYPLSLVLFTISISVVSTAIASFLTTKYLFNRIKPLLPWAV